MESKAGFSNEVFKTAGHPSRDSIFQMGLLNHQLDPVGSMGRTVSLPECFKKTPFFTHRRDIFQ